ncbi:MAG: hypothetical protein ABII02_04770 [Candidatus Magasanikbacteria bacterium]
MRTTITSLLLVFSLLTLSGCIFGKKKDSNTIAPEPVHQAEEINITITESDTIKTLVEILPYRPFEGMWSGEAGGISFTAELYEGDGVLTGYHCGLTENANRIDCCLEGDLNGPSIDGFITDEGPEGEKVKTARLNMKSCYHDAEVVAFITLSEDRKSLVWTLIDDSTIDHYIPEKITLRKK